MNTLIVGSGIAGVTLAEELRKRVPDARVTLLTREHRGYYSRPLLSHGFTRDDIETKIVLKSFAALQESGIEVRAQAEVMRLDLGRQRLRYRQPGGEAEVPYETLVLALGSAAFVPPPFRAQAGLFHTLNSLDDLVTLRALRREMRQRHGVPRWAVIGGGLIGCEVAADLAKAGDSVTLFHALPRLMERQLVEDDSGRLRAVMEQELGVRILLDQAVQGFAESADGLAVNLEGGEESGFHGIVVACGFQPRTELAKAAGLATGRGILVDECLRTADPHVFAIGDVAECQGGRLYAYVTPVRSQALWLAQHLAGQTSEPWTAPDFKPKAKVPGFNALHPYLF